MAADSGVVYLVGAGPGDPALITRRGAELLARAEVVVYDGLVNTALLDLVPALAERIYAGKKRAVGREPMSQEQICACLVEQAAAGRRVVRLKGGDPFIFGRGAEEISALETAGLRYEVVPGVTSATAVAAYAGIPLTARGVSSTVAFATGHEAAGKPSSEVDWQGLARAGTVVLFMALRTARECTQRLIDAGRAPDTPAAAIYWGTTAAQRTILSTLAELPEAIETASLRPPVLIVVGEVAKLRQRGSWYEERPLFGVRVLCTRSLERAADFSHELAELGAEPVVCPVTRIEPAVDAKAWEHFASQASAYDWVVFTSATAVRSFFDELVARGVGDARRLGNARIACVGPVTAAALGPWLRADLVPDHGDAAGVARELINAAGGNLRGAKVLVPRASNGRNEAIAAMRAAGAEVDLLPLYRTVPIASADHAIAYGLELLRSGKAQVAAFFAPSQVRALFEQLGADAVELVSACELIAAIGNTTARALESHGVRVDVVPSTPTAQVLAREIAAWYSSRGSKES